MDLPPSNIPRVKNNQLKIISPDSLGSLALDIWRLRSKMIKLQAKVDEDLLKPIVYCIESCERSLAEIGIEIKDDYAGKVYKSSMNVDVVTYESISMEGDEAKIKETVEPAILIQNVLLHRAKVVITTPKV